MTHQEQKNRMNTSKRQRQCKDNADILLFIWNSKADQQGSSGSHTYLKGRVNCRGSERKERVSTVRAKAQEKTRRQEGNKKATSREPKNQRARRLQDKSTAVTLFSMLGTKVKTNLPEKGGPSQRLSSDLLPNLPSFP